MKAIKYLAMVAMVALLGVTMTSCGGYSNGKAKDMIVKNNDGKLEEADYATMIEWVQEYYDNYNDEWESIIEDNKDNKQEYDFAAAEMKADFAGDYTFIDDIETILSTNAIDEKKAGKENKEAWEKLTTKNDDRKAALQKKVPAEKEN